MNSFAKGGVLACTLMVIGALTGCAQATVVGAQSEVPSFNCSTTGILEWDGSPGSETRSGAIQSQLSYFEGRAALLPRDATRAPSPVDDPVMIRITVRGLASLLDEVPSAEKALSKDEEMTVTSHSIDGQVLASATVMAMSEGGYRVDTYSVTGWVSDDPSCVAEDATSQ
ncbi:hypothetical protein [Glaciibacter psychrotolerans]|uniref:Lipoprotein n=1 Tax=Glaciibacter psychrotolerans TaxID=670054 RepID=A0A7Z0EBG5_9MICO|nr:hypothetical protein [Leifsonia psychrotolerans]NYJ18534.1 hypothetical protein [Leifsonia psychrotolerans]